MSFLNYQILVQIKILQRIQSLRRELIFMQLIFNIIQFQYQQALSITMLAKYLNISKFMFAIQAVKSIPGHKPPAIADTVAGRYAGSLFTSASKKQALDVVLSDLTHLQKVIKQQETIQQFLKNSAIKRSQQREIINSFALEQYTQVTNNFLNTIIEAGRLSDLPKMIETFISYCKILNKQEDIKIISAVQLNEQQKTKVLGAVKKNKPDVKFKVTYEIDPTILGGLQIFAGTQFLDCSLRSRMARLKTQLSKIA